MTYPKEMLIEQHLEKKKLKGDLLMDYKDDNGKVLKGFSQIDLDLLNKNIIDFKRWFVFIMLLWLAVFLWIIWQLKKYQIITQLIQAL
jgi:hypothetical protein